MKITDLNENLSEGPISGPAGFAQRAKAKLQKHVTPFMKQQQKRGKLKDELFKKAKDIKNELKAYMEQTGKSKIGMKEFLDWMENNSDSHAGTLAAAKEIHTNLFPKDSKADIQNQVSTDGVNYSVELDKTGAPKKEKPKPEGMSPEDEKAARDKIAADAEAEAKESGSEDDEPQDLKASKGDNEKPKVDTSASIYEARLRAILEAKTDQSLAASADGEISSDELEDNQIDTLIVKGLQKQRELEATGKVKPKQKAADPEQAQQAAQPEADPKAAKAGKAKAAPSSSSIGAGDIQQLKEILDRLGEDIYTAIRKQDGIEPDVKKQLVNKIKKLVYDLDANSF